MRLYWTGCRMTTEPASLSSCACAWVCYLRRQCHWWCMLAMVDEYMGTRRHAEDLARDPVARQGWQQISCQSKEFKSSEAGEHPPGLQKLTFKNSCWSYPEILNPFKKVLTLWTASSWVDQLSETFALCRLEHWEGKFGKACAARKKMIATADHNNVA